MKKITLLIFAVLWITGMAHAQNQANIEALILQGKENSQKAIDAWDFQRMLGARAFFERLLSDPTYPWLVHYYIGFVDMRIFHYYFSQEKKDEAKEFADDGIAHLEKAVELKNDFAEAYALLSAMYGNKIALNPMLGMTLGQKSGSMIQRAFEIDPENPRVSFIAGQSAYYTPKMFGGGKEKALQYIQKAVSFFQTFQPERSIDPDWGYDEAYAYLGMIQMDQGDRDEANLSFEKALEINPDYGWVKYNLLPQLEKKTEGKKEQ
jgi:tetratricopeptide (TPR) repeat protein